MERRACIIAAIRFTFAFLLAVACDRRRERFPTVGAVHPTIGGATSNHIIGGDGERGGRVSEKTISPLFSTASSSSSLVWRQTDTALQQCSPRNRPLRPTDLPPLRYFDEWQEPRQEEERNANASSTSSRDGILSNQYNNHQFDQTMYLSSSGETVVVRHGSIPQLGWLTVAGMDEQEQQELAKEQSTCRNATTTSMIATVAADATCRQETATTVDDDAMSVTMCSTTDEDDHNGSAACICSPDDIAEAAHRTSTAALEMSQQSGRKTKQQQQRRSSSHRISPPASNFSMLVGVVDRDSVQRILDLLHEYEQQPDFLFDQDPDTVDGMPTYEIFVDSIELRHQQQQQQQQHEQQSQQQQQSQYSPKYADTTAEGLAKRQPLRDALQHILQPILDSKITPFVNERFPHACQKQLLQPVDTLSNSTTTTTATTNARACTPCYSLIRRYRYGERQSHATHHDGHAIATVVISLSDAETEYRGGLYVAHTDAAKAYLSLNRGDAAVHQSDLLHGVKVEPLVNRPQDTVRWSWILWYRDSTTCDDHGVEWFNDCAITGNPTCQMLLATKVGRADEVLEWNVRAAHGGQGRACVKIARAYLKLLPSSLSRSTKKAAEYYLRGIECCNEPDAHYGMATMILDGLSNRVVAAQQQAQQQQQQYSILVNAAAHGREMIRVVAHLEAAAKAGHVFAMFNLGMVHLFGYGYMKRNPELAGEWFEASGLPEGLACKAMQVGAIPGRDAEAREWMRRAHVLGYGQSWRKVARQHTGSGGASGVDINLNWPPISIDGNKPAEF